MKGKPHIPQSAYERVVSHINRKQWWHVPPADSDAYKKRGKFLASSFSAAEFYGRPLDEPQKVAIKKPLVGDEETISKVLGIPAQHEGMTLEEIAEHDARWKSAALAKGFDSIVLMAPKAFARFKVDGKLPRSLELNILNVGLNQEETLRGIRNRPQPSPRRRMKLNAGEPSSSGPAS